MTLTATAYKGKIREIYTSRIGFCGHYNKEILSKMGSEFRDYMPSRQRLHIGKNQLLLTR